MELNVIEGLVERRFAHPRDLQHLDTIIVTENTRFSGTGAQRVGYFGGLPMGMHIDHGYFLHEFLGSLVPQRLFGKYDGCQGTWSVEIDWLDIQMHYVQQYCPSVQ
jgi:hypothetical protein